MGHFCLLFNFTPFTWAFETITDGIGERRADRRDQKRREQRELEEQARREAEAKANRGRGAGNEQTKTRADNDRIEERRNQQQNRPPVPPFTGERRSYEQILGLTDGWTQDDLKKAYQREANRTHPDKWIGKPQAIQDMMEAEYKAVQEAYRILKK